MPRFMIFISLLLVLFSQLACLETGNSDTDGDFISDGDFTIDGDIESEAETIDGDLDILDNETELNTDGDIEEEQEIGIKPLVSEAGYINIEPINYYFETDSHKKELVSSEAKLWFVFKPADEEPETKPLVVFFNGGPGSATGLLFGFNTGPITLDPNFTGDQLTAENEASWTAFANLLYVDARQTGFSYCEMDFVENEDKRKAEFSGKNFNSIFDGADFVRVILRFLKQHPAIQANPVIIAGESYGGIRSTVILHMMLNYKRYANGESIYQDQALVDEIEEHYKTVFESDSEQELSVEKIAEQFGHQVLIQPLLSGQYQDQVAGEMWEQDDSVMFQIAAEEGVQFVPCKDQGNDCNPYNNGLMFLYNDGNRDIYNYSEPMNWLNDLADQATERLLQKSVLEIATGYDPLLIDSLYANNRTRAYRLSNPEVDWASKRYSEKELAKLPLVLRMELLKKSRFKSLATTAGEMTSHFGELKPWDRYYLSINEQAHLVFYLNDLLIYPVDPYQSAYGDMFLENLLNVKTFITNAGYDLIIYAPAMATALSMHDNLVTDVNWQKDLPASDDRPGLIEVSYQENAFGIAKADESRTIRFPLYSKSCHAVEITEPVELLEDVIKWFAE